MGVRFGLIIINFRRNFLEAACSFPFERLQQILSERDNYFQEYTLVVNVKIKINIVSDKACYCLKPF